MSVVGEEAFVQIGERKCLLDAQLRLNVHATFGNNVVLLRVHPDVAIVPLDADGRTSLPLRPRDDFRLEGLKKRKKKNEEKKGKEKKTQFVFLCFPAIASLLAASNDLEVRSMQKLAPNSIFPVHSQIYNAIQIDIAISPVASGALGSHARAQRREIRTVRVFFSCFSVSNFERVSNFETSANTTPPSPTSSWTLSASVASHCNMMRCHCLHCRRNLRQPPHRPRRPSSSPRRSSALSTPRSRLSQIVDRKICRNQSHRSVDHLQRVPRHQLLLPPRLLLIQPRQKRHQRSPPPPPPHRPLPPSPRQSHRNSVFANCVPQSMLLEMLPIVRRRLNRQRNRPHPTNSQRMPLSRRCRPLQRPKPCLMLSWKSRVMEAIAIHTQTCPTERTSNRPNRSNRPECSARCQWSIRLSVQKFNAVVLRAIKPDDGCQNARPLRGNRRLNHLASPTSRQRVVVEDVHFLLHDVQAPLCAQIVAHPLLLLRRGLPLPSAQIVA